MYWNRNWTGGEWIRNFHLIINENIFFSLKYTCSPTLPNCDETTPGDAHCTNVRNPACAPPNNEFVCTGTGVYPDPLNCKHFYFCSIDAASGALIADQYECANLYVFDPSGPKNEYCRLTNNQYCTQITCNGTAQNVLLTYQYFPKSMGQIVASCRTDSTEPYVFRCEAGFVANLNTLPIQCDLNCSKADKAAYPGDKTKYYECLYNGSIWVSHINSCFKGYVFDATLKQCVVAPAA